jgi:hypothetical protein
MEADFDLSRLDEIPDVLPPELAAPVPVPPVGLPTSPGVAGPARGSLRTQRAVAFVVSLGWLAFQTVTLGLRPDFAKLGLPYILALIVFPAVLSAAALGIAIWPGRDGLGVGVTPLRVVALAGIVGVPLLALFFPVPFEYVSTSRLSFAQWVLVCWDVVAVMGAVPLVLAAVVLRRSFPVAATERAATIGVACGMGALTAMHLHCPNIQPAHVLASHVGPAVVLAIVAAVILRHTSRV